MKKLLIACLLLALGAPSLKADEGMWLLPYLEKLNIRDMKARVSSCRPRTFTT